MNRAQRNIALALVLSVLSLARAEARDKGPFEVTLQYMPQESVASSVPVLAPGMTERPVKLVVEDGRSGDKAIIGQGSDDDDKVSQVRARNDVTAFLNEVFQKNAAEWGIKTAADAPMTLTGRLTRINLLESNKAVGSTYNSDVQLVFALQGAKGKTLWEGTAVGDATRYGRKRSEENANEVISDAVKEAYANLLGDAGLQGAWTGKPVVFAGGSTAPAAAPSSPAVSPSELLAELVNLKKQGFTTELLVDYVDQKNLSSALTADDMVKWKNAGMPQEVIKAALAKGK